MVCELKSITIRHDKAKKKKLQNKRYLGTGVNNEGWGSQSQRKAHQGRM